MATMTNGELLRKRFRLTETRIRVKAIKRLLEAAYGAGKVTVRTQYSGPNYGQMVITIETQHSDGLYHQVDAKIRRVVPDLPGRLQLYSCAPVRRNSSIEAERRQLQKPKITRQTK
jgi:hypothetical protein